jgi:hypothetical protein
VLGTNLTPRLNNEVDGCDFLKRMHWAGSATVWSFTGGVPNWQLLAAHNGRNKAADFTFVHIGDSLTGFNRPANASVNGARPVATGQIYAAVHQLDLILHTRDLTHLAKARAFDTLGQIVKDLRQIERIDGGIERNMPECLLKIVCDSADGARLAFGRCIRESRRAVSGMWRMES